MKKSIAFVVALVFVLSFASMAAAAPNPFVDVPASHWSYDAVQTLVKAGVVDGYNDRTFRGDNTITRYELAQIVAKAMAYADKNGDKVTADQKKLIDKLSAEYAAELKNLGVRVAKLEATKSMINFFIDDRIMYVYNNEKLAANNYKINDKNLFMQRLRVYISSPGYEKWSFMSRLQQSQWNMRNSANGVNNDNSLGGQFRFDRFYVTGKDLLGFDVQLGRMDNYPGKGAFFGLTGSYDGMKVTKKIGNVTANAMMGRDNLMGNGVNLMKQVEFKWQINKKADFGGYFLYEPVNYGRADNSDKKMYAINGAAEVYKNLALSFEWATNKANFVGKTGNDPKGYFVALQSKYAATNYMPNLYTNMVNPFKKGDHGWAVSYRHLPTGVGGYLNIGPFNNWNTVAAKSGTNFLNNYNDVNVWRVDYLTVPWKMVQLTVAAERVKPIGANISNHQDAWYDVQTTFNFFF